MRAATPGRQAAGGDDTFGPNFGGAEVYTNVRAGYLGECPNVGTLVKNLKFSLKMENEIMNKILNDGEDPEKAAGDWLKANPSAVDFAEALRAVEPIEADLVLARFYHARRDFIAASGAVAGSSGSSRLAHWLNQARRVSSSG